MEITSPIIDTQIEKPKRSEFLKTLCILTFVMCGISVIIGISDIYSKQPEVMQQKIEQMQEFSPEIADFMTNQLIELEHNAFMRIFPYLNIVFILISFLGAMMIWNLKKAGFYIYAIAELLPYSSLIFVGSVNISIPGLPSWFAPVMQATSIIIDLVFVFLYSRNLKELK